MAPSSEEDETDAPDLTLASPMDYQRVLRKRRLASLYFGLKSSSKVLFFTFIPLLLRANDFNKTSVGYLRTFSVLFSHLFVALLLILVKSHTKRKHLAHLALVIACAAIFGFLFVPTQNVSSNQTNSTSKWLWPGSCDSFGNQTQFESNSTEVSNSVEISKSTPEFVNSTPLGNTFKGTQYTPDGRNTDQRFFSSSLPPQPISRTPFREASTVWTNLPQTTPFGFTQRASRRRQDPEPEWLKKIIDQSNQNRPLIRPVRDLPLDTVVQSTTEGDKSSSIELPTSFFQQQNTTAGVGGLLTDFKTFLFRLSFSDAGIVVCLALVCAESFLNLSDRISFRLYRNYLDQNDYGDKFFSHLPFAQFLAFIGVVVSMILSWEFRCEIASNYDVSTAIVVLAGVVLGAAILVFTCFPVPERRKQLQTEPFDQNPLTVFGNPRMFILWISLIILGAAFGAEQNFVLWHLVDNNVDMITMSAFIALPLIVSAIGSFRIQRRSKMINRFLLAALLSVNVRFIVYAIFDLRDTNEKIILIFVQILSPLSTTLLVEAVDNFLQDVSFPSDHSSISSKMHVSHWTIGYSTGSLFAAQGWSHIGFSLTFYTIGIACGVWALVILILSRWVSLQDTKESRYSKIIDKDQRPINHFEESDSEEEDQRVEFQIKGAV